MFKPRKAIQDSNLFKLDEELTLADSIAFSHRNVFNDATSGSDYIGLHLHCLQDQQILIGLDLIAHFDQNLEYCAR